MTLVPERGNDQHNSHSLCSLQTDNSVVNKLDDTILYCVWISTGGLHPILSITRHVFFRPTDTEVLNSFIVDQVVGELSHCLFYVYEFPLASCLNVGQMSRAQNFKLVVKLGIRALDLSVYPFWNQRILLSTKFG